MAVVIRMKRTGAIKRPRMRIVVTDERSPRDGRFIEEVGYYDSTKEPAVVKIDAERVKHWLGRGAQPSDTVRSLLKREKIL